MPNEQNLYYNPVTGQYSEAKGPEDEKTFQDIGMVPAGEAAAIQQSREKTHTENYGGALNELYTFGQGGLGALSFGGSDYALKGLGVEVGEYAKENPEHRTVGEVTGALASIGAGGEGLVGQGLKYTPAGMSTVLGRNAAGAFGKGSMAARLAGSMAEGYIDGAAFGAGQAVSHAALNDDELTIEAVAAGAWDGGWLGGGIGGAFGLVGEGARKLNRANTYSELTSGMQSGFKSHASEFDELAKRVEPSFAEAESAAAFDPRATVKGGGPAKAAETAPPRDTFAGGTEPPLHVDAPDTVFQRGAPEQTVRVGRETTPTWSGRADEILPGQMTMPPEGTPVPRRAGDVTANVRGGRDLGQATEEIVATKAPSLDTVPEARLAEAVDPNATNPGFRKAADADRTLVDAPTARTAVGDGGEAAYWQARNAWEAKNAANPFVAQEFYPGYGFAGRDTVAGVSPVGQIKAALNDVRAARKGLNPEAYNVSKVAREKGEVALEMAQKWSALGKAAKSADAALGTDMAKAVWDIPTLPADISKNIGSLDQVALSKALGVKPEVLEAALPSLSPQGKAFLDAVAVSKGLDQGLAGEALKVAVIGAKLAAAVPVGGLAKLGSYGLKVMGSNGSKLLRGMVEAVPGLKGRVEGLVDRVTGAVDAPLKGVARGVPKLVGPGASSGVVLFNRDIAREEDESDAQYELRQIREALNNPDLARQGLDDSLLVMRGVHSSVGHAVADKKMQQLEYLASQAPESQRGSAFQSNPVKVPMTPIEEAKWNRVKHATLDPVGALDDGLRNRTLSADTIAAVKAVWPRTFETFQQQLLTKLYFQKTPPAYEDRIVISQLLEGKYEKSLDATLAVQSMFARTNQQAQPQAPSGKPKSPDQPTTAQRIESK
jgi:hypothetical protein